MWVAAAAIAASLVAELAMNPEVGPTPFMLIVLALCAGAAVSGVGLIREVEWAYDTVSDLSWILIVSTVIHLPFIVDLSVESLGFVVLIFVSYALALYSLSTMQIADTRRRLPASAPYARRIKRYPRFAGAALVILGVSILWALVRWTDMVGSISPLVGVIMLFLVLSSGLGIGLLAGVEPGAPLRVVSWALRVGAILYLILNMIGGGFAPSASTWEQFSGAGTVIACFVVAWYSIACVKQADLEDARIESSLPA
jgi:hypothetical protein